MPTCHPVVVTTATPIKRGLKAHFSEVDDMGLELLQLLPRLKGD